jgi:hypothetical protein
VFVDVLRIDELVRSVSELASKFANLKCQPNEAKTMFVDVLLLLLDVLVPLVLALVLARLVPVR